MDLSGFTVILGLVSLGTAIACFQKGKTIFGVLGVLGMIPFLAPVLSWFSIIGAVRLAKPTSSWAARYTPTQMEVARQRFPNAGSRSIPSRAQSQRQVAATDPAERRRSDVAEFLVAALDAGVIDADTHHELVAFLAAPTAAEPSTAAPAVPEQPWVHPPRKTAPASTSSPKPAEPPPAPVLDDLTRPAPNEKPLAAAAVAPATRPLESPPPPPPPREPAEPTRAVILWNALVSDVALHGLSYLGVLLTFVGILGFLLFAFVDVPDTVQPFIELIIVVVLFGWSWFLRQQQATLAAQTMELLGGLVLPLVLFASLVDNAPVPPDFEGGPLVAALTGSALGLSAVYTWISARKPASMLRFLVAPLWWLAAAAAGFVFKTDEALASDAITRLVSAQGALAAAAIAATLVFFGWRREHRLAAPSTIAALVGVPVTYLLTISLAFGEAWAHTAPLIVLGIATFVSAELLARWFERTAWLTVARPLLLAGVLVPLVPAIGASWSGVLITIAYLGLLEPAPRRDTDDYVPLTLSGVGAAAGLFMTLLYADGQPWAALVASTVVTVWAHRRRTQPELESEARQALTTIAALAPVAVAYALAQLIHGDAVWVVYAAILVVTAAAVRVRPTSDDFWVYWPTAAALVVAVGTTFTWTRGPQLDWYAALAMSGSAVTVWLGHRWPVARLWLGSGLLAAAVAMALETGDFSFDQRVVVWASLGFALVVAGGLWRRPPAAHLAAIGHLVGLGALAGVGDGAPGVLVLGFWTAGWIVSVVASQTDGDSITALWVRLAGMAEDTVGPRLTTVVQWVAPVVMALSIPPTVVSAANQWGEFAAHRSWTGITMALVAVGYAAVARMVREHRPLATVLSYGAAAASIVGVAVAAPDRWPTMVAAVAVIAVAALLSPSTRWPAFVWFAWFMSLVFVVLLSEQAGVPTDALYLVSLVWGGMAFVGGLILDDLRAGRRQPGEGLRVAWLRYPVVLGALVVPVALAPVFTQEPQVFGWWCLGAGAAYIMVAGLLRVGAVSAAGYALLTVGVVALAPVSMVAEPWRLVIIAAPLVLISFITEKVQRQSVASDGWLRWDLAPLAVAVAVSVVALGSAIADAALAPAALAFGSLAVGVGMWKRTREWIEVGNLLLVVSALEAGMGWLTLALGLTALRGALGTRYADVRERLSYQLIAVTSAAIAWPALLAWQDLSPRNAADASAVFWAAVTLMAVALGRLHRLGRDTMQWWGGLGLLGAAITFGVTLANGGPGIEGPWFAVALAILAFSFELAAAMIDAGLRYVSVAAVAGSWWLLLAGMGWSDQTAALETSAVVWAALALVVASLGRVGTPAREAVIRWGGLAAAGTVASVAIASSEGGLRGAGPWFAVSLAVLALALEIGAAQVGPRLRYGSVVTSGLSWLMLLVGMGWVDERAVLDASVVAWGAFALGIAVLGRLGRVSVQSMVRWGGLGGAAAGVAIVLAFDAPGAWIEGPWIAIGLALLAAASEFAGRLIYPALRYSAVVGAGLAWVALVVGLGWQLDEAAAVTSILGSGLALMVAETARARGLASDRTNAASPVAVARAWWTLGALSVGFAAVVQVAADDPASSVQWAAAGLVLLAVAAARGARPLHVTWMRDAAGVLGLGSLLLWAIAFDWPRESLAVLVVIVGAAATLTHLLVWRRDASSVWVRPLAVLGVVASGLALALGLLAWPDRALLVAVLLAVGIQAVAVGIWREWPILLASGPPLIGLGFILGIAENVSGSAQWYTLPIGLVVLAEAEILRSVRRARGEPTNDTSVLVTEWAGIGLVAAPALVEMFTSGIGFGLVAFLVAAMSLVWAIVTRVRRRAVAAAALAVAAAVLLIFAAAASSAPGSAYVWVLAVGIGFTVMLVGGLIEAYRSKNGRVMARLDQLMEGWE